MSTAMAGAAKDIHQEQPVRTYSGFVALAIGIALLVLAGWLVNDIFANVRARAPISFAMLAATVVVAITAVLVPARPLHAAAERGGDPPALRRYRGTTRAPGLRATNPFYTRKKLSLRARNLNGERLKVNDKRGNPIEIAAVVVWRVDDTAQAVFDVDDYENYVQAAERGRGAPPRVVVRLRRCRSPTHDTARADAARQRRRRSRARS